MEKLWRFVLVGSEESEFASRPYCGLYSCGGIAFERPFTRNIQREFAEKSSILFGELLPSRPFLVIAKSFVAESFPQLRGQCRCRGIRLVIEVFEQDDEGPRLSS